MIFGALMIPSNLPDRPQQSQEPWYSSREVYDSSMEEYVSRAFGSHENSQLTSDPNELYRPTDQGAYTLTSSSPSSNLPFRVTSIALLEVTSAGSNMAAQKFIDSNGISWRAVSGFSGSTPVWSNWGLAPGHLPKRQTVDDGVDLNNLRSDVELNVPANAQTEHDVDNLPLDIPAPTRLKVLSWGPDESGDFAHQELRGPGQYWIRSTNENGSWMDWERIL